MVLVATSLLFLTGAVCLTAGAILHNQIEPNTATALTVPLANLASVLAASVGTAVAGVAYGKNRDMQLARRTLVFGLGCAAILLIMLPLSELGYLSTSR